MTWSFVPCGDGHQSSPFTLAGFARPWPSTPRSPCWVALEALRRPGWPAPAAPALTRGSPTFEPGIQVLRESHGEYCRQDSAQRSQVTHEVTAKWLRTRSSPGERTPVVARFQSCERAVVTRRLGSSCLATPQPVGVRQRRCQPDATGRGRRPVQPSTTSLPPT